MGANYAPCKYDGANRLVEFSTDKNVTKLIYDDNDKIIEADYIYDSILNRKLTFTYDGNIITEKGADILNGSIINPFTNIITLDRYQRPIKLSTVGGSADSYLTFTYDIAGNMATFAYHFSSTSIVTQSYTFDDKKSSLKDIKGNYYLITRDAELTNNITSSVQTIFDGFSTTTATTIAYSNYVYNELGYPISRLVKSNYGLNYTQQYIYTVK